MSEIVDVSAYQGSINWAAVKAAGVKLAIIKATEGIGFVDARFAQNWAGAAAAGVPRGAYHFAHPDSGNQPTAEADFFLSVVRAHGLTPADRLAEDYEVAGGGAVWSLAFLGRLQASTGILPEFYSNYSGCFRVCTDGRMAQYPLWLAWPGNPAAGLPQCPSPWTSIAIWQYATGSVPGIGTAVDQDLPIAIFGGFLMSLTDAQQLEIYNDVKNIAAAVGTGPGETLAKDLQAIEAVFGIKPGTTVAAFDPTQNPDYLGWTRGTTAALDALKVQVAAIPIAGLTAAQASALSAAAAGIAKLEAFFDKGGA